MGKTVAQETGVARSENCSEAKASFSWDAVLKWSALVITLSGLALHAAGSRYHVEHLGAWGLDSDLFPKPVEWVLMAGYYVLVGALGECYLYFKTYWWKLAIWGLCLALMAFGLSMAILKSEAAGLRHFLCRPLKIFPRWVLVLGVTSSYMSAMCLLIFISPLLLVGVLYLPSLLGAESGQKVAKGQIDRYRGGCSTSEASQRCIVFRRLGLPDLKGFLIESSDAQLAIYLPDQKLVQIIKRDGVEMEVKP
ncbi:MAG: hypothetical protein QM776_01565 [Rhodocyclaceae bacterium]